MHLYVQDMYYNNTLDALTRFQRATGKSWLQYMVPASVAAKAAVPSSEYSEVPTWHFLEFMSHPAVGLRPHESFVDVDQVWVGTCLLAAKFLKARRAVGIELNRALWRAPAVRLRLRAQRGDTALRRAARTCACCGRECDGARSARFRRGLL